MAETLIATLVGDFPTLATVAWPTTFALLVTRSLTRRCVRFPDLVWLLVLIHRFVRHDSSFTRTHCNADAPKSAIKHVMVRMMFVAALIASGCKQKAADDKGATPGKSGAMGPSGDMGSAMGTAPIATDAAIVVDAAATTAEDIAKHYADCVAARNDARWDAWKACYVDAIMFEQPGLGATPLPLATEIAAAQSEREMFPDLRQDPQLVLVSESTVIAIVLVTATGPKTGKQKPFGIYLGNVVASDPTGAFTRDLAFYDSKTLEAQIMGKPGVRAVAKPFPAKLTVIAKDDDLEKKNRDTFMKMMEASEKRDLATYGSFIADNVVWSVQNQPKDLTKAEILGGMKVRMEKTDLHYKLDHAWAAGDYVASLETVAGTATADSPDQKIKRGDKIEKQLLAVHRFADGKLVQVWVFVQS
jgi:ketosteroid isomerase-like protein